MLRMRRNERRRLQLQESMQQLYLAALTDSAIQSSLNFLTNQQTVLCKEFLLPSKNSSERQRGMTLQRYTVVLFYLYQSWTNTLVGRVSVSQ